MKGTLGAVWGVAGICAIIVDALVRIVPLGVEAYRSPMTWVHWLLLATWVPAMIWGEGYKGFVRSFSPMVGARARYLRANPRTLHVLLAPIFCLGLMHATRRRLTRSTLLTLGIVLVIVVVRQLPQPWRGIIDLGVVGGLGIGLLSLPYFLIKALRAQVFEVDPEVPEAP